MKDWIADHSYYMGWVLLAIILPIALYVLRDDGKDRTTPNTTNMKIRIYGRKGKSKYRIQKIPAREGNK